MKILSAKSELCDFDKEVVLVTSNKFSVTNKYVVPFLYFELLRYSVPIADYPKEDVEDFFYYTAESRAINYALFLEALANGITVSQEEIDSKILEISANDIETFKKNFEKSAVKYEFVVFDATQVIAIEKMKTDIILKNINITEEEAAEFYQNNPSLSLINPQASVRHILIKTKGLTPTEKEEKYKLIKEIAETANLKNFASLAIKYSDDLATKNAGGKLGNFVEKGKMIKEFEEAVFNTPAGEISDVFETEAGYHIVKVEKIKTKGKKKFIEVKEEIERILLIDKKNQAIDKFKRDTEEKYQIKVLR